MTDNKARRVTPCRRIHPEIGTFESIGDFPNGTHMLVPVEVWKRVEQMLKVKKAADGGTELVSNQGQALDGYSELANYRRTLAEIGGEDD